MISIKSGCLGQMWVPVEIDATVYVGSIVGLDYSDVAGQFGVTIWDEADGTNNTSNLGDIPMGIVIGTNNSTPVYNSTYKAEYITAGSVSTATGSTNSYVGVEGPYGKSCDFAMVKIDLIGPGTVLRSPIYNNAVGTAPALLTATATDTNGDQFTTNSCDFTPVDGENTIYCRSGGNAGDYRITTNTSKTVHDCDYDMRGAVAIGDTFVTVPIRPFGQSKVRFGNDTVCSFINCSDTPASNYCVIHVLKLNLEVAGNEYCEFWFDGDNFCTARA